MALSEVDVILRDLDKNLEDMHLLFVNDVSSMDLPFYNTVHLALLEAKEKIKNAQAEYDSRMEEVRKSIKQPDILGD